MLRVELPHQDVVGIIHLAVRGGRGRGICPRHDDGTSGWNGAVSACRAFRQARRGVRPQAMVEIDYPAIK
jgi:hypothetical protein